MTMAKDAYRINEWELATTNLHRIGKRRYEVAVLPTGAIEAHNRHLPEGQDWLHTMYVARACCERAWKACESVICLPALPYGVDCNQMALPLTIHVSQATLDAMVREIIVSLRHHGIRKVMILNGHGGNEFKPLIRQIQCDMDVHVFLCNWWLAGRDKFDEIFTKPDDHGGQLETSVAMALFPELVEPDVAGDGEARPFRFEALRRGYVSTSRDFAKLNDHAACGDPSESTAERGRQYLDLVIERISEFLVQLAREPIDASFPQTP
jgi:creatinine amidohydrolase